MRAAYLGKDTVSNKQRSFNALLHPLADYDNMDKATSKTTLVKAAEAFLATAKSFDGNPVARAAQMKQADNLRLYSEDALGTMLRLWDAISKNSRLERHMLPFDR